MDFLLTVTEYFLWFILYSVCGWIIETLLYIVVQKRVVKRGFLFGPLCPIYGFGAVLSHLLFYGRIENIVLLFFVGMLVCTALEYITHFVMQKAFHATWWDYSGKRFNVKGRICLQNSLLFGAGVVLIVKVLQPWVIYWTEKIPQSVLLWVGLLLYSILLLDLATTVAGLKNTVQMLQEVQSMVGEYMQKGLDNTDEHFSEIAERLKDSEPFGKLVEKMRRKGSPLQKLHALFPNFTLERYKDALKVIFEKKDDNKKP